jgi:integrase
LAAKLNEWVTVNQDSSEYAELARRAGADAIAAWTVQQRRQPSLFGTGDTAAEIWAKAASAEGFCELARIFYSSFTERYLRYFLEREASAYLSLETGRRIGAICALRTEDLRLEPTEMEPFGSICWPSDTDKCGREWSAPLNERARAAIDLALKKRQAIGPGFLFLAPKDRTRPVRVEQASSWLRQAEQLAGLDHLKGGNFHPYRRLWASTRKELSDLDVMAVGGWASLAALKSSYQKPDPERMLTVALHQADLKEVR